MVLEDFTIEIESLVRDTSDKLIADDYERCLKRALERYTLDRAPVTGTIHLVTNTDSTVYENDFYAVCNLGAGIACGVLAQEFIPSVDKYPQADFAALQSKVDHYRSRRRDFIKEYEDHMRQVLGGTFILGEINTAWMEDSTGGEI